MEVKYPIKYDAPPGQRLAKAYVAPGTKAEEPTAAPLAAPAAPARPVVGAARKQRTNN